MAVNICLVLREFLRIAPHTILLEAALLLSHIGDFLLRIARSIPLVRIIKSLLLILSSTGITVSSQKWVGENSHSDLIKYLQLGCPFEHRSWDLQSTKLGFHSISLFFQRLKSHSYQRLSTNSLFKPLVSRSAILSFDFTQSIKIIPVESSCLMVLCLQCMCLDLPLYMLLCALLIADQLSQCMQIVGTGFSHLGIFSRK